MANAKTIKKTFSRHTRVSNNIRATPAKIWKILTNANNFPVWNSTITSLEGEIRTGQTIKLKSYLDSKRVFKIKIKEMIPNQKMVWGDQMGNRIFELKESGDGTTNFSMDEKIGGLLFPLFASKIPPFDESFNIFAADLKRTAEK